MNYVPVECVRAIDTQEAAGRIYSGWGFAYVYCICMRLDRRKLN